MAVQTWTGGSLGSGLTWTDVGSESNAASMPAGDSVIITSSALANGSAGDEHIDISVATASFTPGAGNPNLQFGTIYLNQDGSTYSNGGVTGTQSANGIAAEDLLGPGVSGLPSTAAALTGMVKNQTIIPGSFHIVEYNNTGATLPSTQTVKWRSYIQKVA